MRTTKYLGTMSFNSPSTGLIELDIHEVDGGVIAVQPEYTEDIANYIINPYSDCQLLFLAQKNLDEAKEVEPDPSLDENPIVGFLKIVKVAESVMGKKTLSALTKIPENQITILLGMASDALDDVNKT